MMTLPCTLKDKWGEEVEWSHLQCVWWEPQKCGVDHSWRVSIMVVIVGVKVVVLDFSKVGVPRVEKLKYHILEPGTE